MVERRTYNTPQKSLGVEAAISKDYERRRPEAGEKAVVPRKQQDISSQTAGGQIKVLEGLLYWSRQLQPLELCILIRSWKNTGRAHPVNTQSKHQYTPLISKALSTN